MIKSKKLGILWEIVFINFINKVSYDNSGHTIILEYFSLKEWALSNFAFQSFYVFIGTQTKRFFQMLWLLFEGWTNRAQPSYPFLFNHLKFFGQMYFFDALWKCYYMIFAKKCPKLRPSAVSSGSIGSMGLFQKVILTFEKIFLFCVSMNI